MNRDGKGKKKVSLNEELLWLGIQNIRESPLFSRLFGEMHVLGKDRMGKETAAFATLERGWGSTFSYHIYLNKDYPLAPDEWAYVIAHCLLHFAFGHFDADRVPYREMVTPDGKVERKPSFHHEFWNMACDIYVARFLEDVKFGKSICPSTEPYRGMGRDERQIYAWLLEHGIPEGAYFGTAKVGIMDMRGLDEPAVYETPNQKRCRASEQFGVALAYSVTQVVGEAGGRHEGLQRDKTRGEMAAEWFVNHYPLLGGIATGFRIVEDAAYCMRNEISIAAVDVTLGEIYLNPAARLDEEELRFVLAHEFLHAGLQHHQRCQGRDPYLWNVACDFVIDAWLQEMHVGRMPQDGLLYDEELRGKSSEEIYDIIVNDLRRYSKLNTFRGYGKGDVLGGDGGKWWMNGATSLEDFCKSALAQGLEYHVAGGRGFVPAGLIEEIRALSMPPIPWDVELGRWFDLYFAPMEAKRTYARPSRRQGSAPDIPRPRYVPAEVPEYSRTFGVVVDTSGSMSAKLIGYALGAIASYGASKEVPYARVVFCDADAYDAGYLAPEDIAGRVAVKGRGGTILQPGVDLLLEAKDFPKDAPILIITDGYIESDLRVKREHAFLVPRGHRLPFRPRGEVFYFSD